MTFLILITLKKAPFSAREQLCGSGNKLICHHPSIKHGSCSHLVLWTWSSKFLLWVYPAIHQHLAGSVGHSWPSVHVIWWSSFIVINPCRSLVYLVIIFDVFVKFSKAFAGWFWQGKWWSTMKQKQQPNFAEDLSWRPSKCNWAKIVSGKQMNFAGVRLCQQLQSMSMPQCN